MKINTEHQYTTNTSFALKKPIKSYTNFGNSEPDIIELQSQKLNSINEDTSIFDNVKESILTTINPLFDKDKLRIKKNQVKLTQLFLKHGTFASVFDALKYKKEIEELAKKDYKKFEEKYLAILKFTQATTHNEEQCKIDMGLNHSLRLFQDDNFTKDNILEILNIEKTTKTDDSRAKLNIRGVHNFLYNYENFENLNSSSQKVLINNIEYCNGKNSTSSYLSISDIKKLPQNSSLMKFAFIRDIKECNSISEIEEKLRNIKMNKPCNAIETDINQINKFLSKTNLEDFKNILTNVDLDKYHCGFKLEYTRNDFIKDFNNLIKDLPDKEKNEIFTHFEFNININNDIINYPNPQTKKISDSTKNKEIIEKAQVLVEKFMLNNKVKLEKEDKELENHINEIIKVFPEFITIIGKMQHRGDSIDFHTFDDLQRIFKNPDYQSLADNEKRILIIATLFHDFGKEENIVDEGHANKSANISKEIIKKLPVSNDEKERIYNLIKHSHWLIDGSTNEDLAFYFRRPNDFKMAEIFEKADCASAGFNYYLATNRLESIKNNIQKINEDGILAFANTLPKQPEYYDVNQHGVKYLDLRDPEASVEKYGYPKGTKVKDLKFFSHSTNDSPKEFEALCNYSKQVCLSTSLLDIRERYKTNYNGGANYILEAGNSNVVIAGKNLRCSGSQRNEDYAKKIMLKEDDPKFYQFYTSKNTMLPFRTEIAECIKKSLNIDNKEYAELFSQIGNLEKKEDIQDVKLSTGKILNKDRIIKTISELQDNLAQPKDKSKGGYTNEFVIYNPQIGARVIDSEYENINNIKESKYPIIYV